GLERIAQGGRTLGIATTPRVARSPAVTTDKHVAMKRRHGLPSGERAMPAHRLGRLAHAKRWNEQTPAAPLSAGIVGFSRPHTTGYPRPARQRCRTFACHILAG